MAAGAPQLWKASPLNSYELTPISAGEVFMFSPGDRARNLAPFLLTRLDTNCAYLFVIQRDWKLLNYKEDHFLQSYLWIGGTASQVAPRRQSIPSREELPFALIKVYQEAWRLLSQIKTKLETSPDHPRQYQIRLTVEMQYQESIGFMDLGRNPIFNQIFINYVDDDQLRALALPGSMQQRSGLFLGFEIFKPKSIEHGLRIFKAHELRHYQPTGVGHGGVVQLDLVQKMAMLSPGSLSYLNRIKDLLLRGYGINKVLPYKKQGLPQPYSIDLRSLYSHPLATLAQPTDFSSFYYCLTKTEEKEEEEQREEAEEGQETKEGNKVEDEQIRSQFGESDRIEGGRSRGLEMNELEKIYDEYELEMNQRDERLKEAKLKLGSVYSVLRSNKTALFRVQTQKAEESIRNRIREMLKRQAVMTGRFMECESEETRVTLKEVALSPQTSLLYQLNKEQSALGSYLLKRFSKQKEEKQRKQLRRLKYELLDARSCYVFNTREAMHFWSHKSSEEELQASLSFLSKLNWQHSLTFSGIVKDLQSELTCRPILIQRAGHENSEFLDYFQTKRDQRVFDYLMLKTKEGIKLKRPRRETASSKAPPPVKQIPSNSPFGDRIKKNKESDSATTASSSSSFVEATQEEDVLSRQLTQDFRMKRQLNLPSAFLLLERYPLFDPKAQIKITYETDRQWQKRYPNLDILYAPREIFHPTPEAKGVFLSRIGGSTVDSLAMFEVNSGNKFRKIDHQDLGRFDANKAYFVVALNKDVQKGEERTNAVIYLWRGESAGTIKDASSAAQKFHCTQFKELSSKDKMMGIRRQSTVHRLSRASSGGIRPSIQAAMDSIQSKPVEDVAQQLGIEKELAEQLHPALLQGALQQRKEKEVNTAPIISLLQPVNGNANPNANNLQPMIDDDSVDVSMRTVVRQDFEPMHFLLLFRGEIIIRTNDYGVIDNDGIMFQLIGQPYISQRAREVPVVYSQLSSAGLFLLLTPDDIGFFWVGREYYRRILEPQLEAQAETAKKLGKPVQLGIEHLISYKLFQRIIATITNITVDIEELRITIMIEGGETSPFLEYMQATPSKQEHEEEDDGLIDQKMFNLNPSPSKQYERRILPLFSPNLRNVEVPRAPRFYCIFREGEVLLPSEGLIGSAREVTEEDEEATSRNGFGDNTLRSKIMHQQLERLSESHYFKSKENFNLGRTSLEVGCIVKGADEGCIFLVDVGSEVFIWVGNRVSLKNKPYALPLGLHLLKEIETQQRRDLNVQKRRIFVRKNSGEHETLAGEEEERTNEEEDEEPSPGDMEDLRAERVSVNLINSGFEPVLFLKLIGVGLPEE